jgi:hypothetical protein
MKSLPLLRDFFETDSLYQARNIIIIKDYDNTENINITLMFIKLNGIHCKDSTSICRFE